MNVLIINGHQPYALSPGKLNATLVERAECFFAARGDNVKVSNITQNYDVDEEISRHQWADAVMIQFPVNWMGVPWLFKKYLDEVYSSGMDGRLCDGDGRSSDDPDHGYGMGGALGGTKYMLSATLNAPQAAFDNAAEPFFAGRSLDDMLYPMHLNAKFMGMSPLKTFAVFDVIKNPQIAPDLDRFDAHLAEQFALVD